MSISFDELFSQAEEESKSRKVDVSKKNKMNALEDRSSSKLEGDPKDDFSSLFEEIKSNAPSRSRSIASAPLKGLIKGAAKFSPLPSFGPVSPKLGERITEQFLPTQEGFPEEVLEMAAENIPLVALGEGGLVKKGLQAASGALTKLGAKEMDLPDWAQEVVGSLGMVSPDLAKSLASKTLKPSSKQLDIVNFLRSKGVSDKDITPIIQDKKKLAFFSKAASKFDKKDSWLKGIKSQLGNIFEDVREQGRKLPPLNADQVMKFQEDFFKKFDKVPRMYRNLVQKEVDDLMSNPVNFTELHDFGKAINAIVGEKEGGKAAIGILKEPIEKAQREISPKLFNDLQKTNHAYSKLYDFTDKMKKRDWHNLINLGQAGQALYGALTLNPVALKAAAVAGSTRYLAKQVLSNPRLQGIHRKMWDSFLNNKISQAIKLSSILKSELNKKESIKESDTP